MNPLVDEYLKNKYGQNFEQNAEETLAEEKSGINTGRLISNLGDAIGGRSVGSQNDYFNSLDKQAKENTVGKVENARKTAMQDMQFGNEMAKAQREKDQFDPNSERSVAFRKVIEAKFPDLVNVYGSDWAKVSAADQDNIFKPLQLRETSDTRKQTAAILAGQKDQANQMRLAEKEDKKKQQMFEIEDRRQNINSNLAALQKMIDEDGTFEMFGSHNADMDRLVDQIATDMAKLQDPSSVARPNEVEMVKKNLVKSGYSGLGTRNDTAANQLKNFENEVNRRADSAYSIRGLQAPNQSQDPDAVKYAEMHGLPYDQALGIINKRRGAPVAGR